MRNDFDEKEARRNKFLRKEEGKKRDRFRREQKVRNRGSYNLDFDDGEDDENNLRSSFAA